MIADPTPRAGKMSNDRVHFTIPYRHLSKKEYQKLLVETLGIEPFQYKPGEDLNVICRPSQFARFVILRSSKYGEPNQMSELQMRLVIPEPEPKVIDCSRNPNKALGEKVMA